MNSSSKSRCCLICSILTALSDVNCCSEHLKLLKTVLPSVLPMQLSDTALLVNTSSNKSQCCERSDRIESKKHRRSHTSSSSSSEIQNENEIQLKSMPSAETIYVEDALVSSKERSTTLTDVGNQELSTIYRQNRSTSERTPCSPLLPSYSLPNSTTTAKIKKIKPKRRVYNKFSTPIESRITRASIVSKSPSVQTETSESNDENMNKGGKSPVYVPRILLNRVVHVKDECEDTSVNKSRIGFNMTQVTDHMIAQMDLKPQISLQRISLGW